MDLILACDIKVQYFFTLERLLWYLTTGRKYREFTRSKKDMLMNLLITLLAKKKCKRYLTVLYRVTQKSKV